MEEKATCGERRKSLRDGQTEDEQGRDRTREEVGKVNVSPFREGEGVRCSGSVRCIPLEDLANQSGRLPHQAMDRYY